MRDPERIDKVLEEIGKIWHKYPDLRLGQLIGNVLEGPNLYYVEDNGLVNALKDMYNGEHEPVDFDNDMYILDLIKKTPEELGFVLDSKNYEEYLKTYETVGGTSEPALTEFVFEALKNYFDGK